MYNVLSCSLRILSLPRQNIFRAVCSQMLESTISPLHPTLLTKSVIWALNLDKTLVFHRINTARCCLRYVHDTCVSRIAKLEGVRTFPLKQNPGEHTLTGDALWIKIELQMRWALAVYILPFLTPTWQPGEINRQDNKQLKEMVSSDRFDCWHNLESVHGRKVSNVKKIMISWICRYNDSDNYMQSYVG